MPSHCALWPLPRCFCVLVGNGQAAVLYSRLVCVVWLLSAVFPSLLLAGWASVLSLPSFRDVPPLAVRFRDLGRDGRATELCSRFVCVVQLLAAEFPSLLRAGLASVVGFPSPCAVTPLRRAVVGCL